MYYYMRMTELDYSSPSPLTDVQIAYQFSTFFEGLMLDDPDTIRGAVSELHNIESPCKDAFLEVAYEVIDRYELAESVDKKAPRRADKLARSTYRDLAAELAIQTWVYSGAPVHAPTLRMVAGMHWRTNLWLMKNVRPTCTRLNEVLGSTHSEDREIYKAYGRAALATLELVSPWPAVDSFIEFIG